MIRRSKGGWSWQALSASELYREMRSVNGPNLRMPSERQHT